MEELSFKKAFDVSSFRTRLTGYLLCDAFKPPAMAVYAVPQISIALCILSAARRH